jgi:UPF0716 protein FxsA
MTRLLPFLFLGGLAAELASIILVGNVLGVFPTLLLLFGGGLLGISLIRSAGTNIAAALRSPIQASSLQRDAAGVAIWRVLSGLLFIVPGFFSDLLGLMLFLPAVRNWLRSRVRVATVSSGAPPERRYETIIEAEAIEIAGEIDPSGPAGKPDGGAASNR